MPSPLFALVLFLVLLLILIIVAEILHRYFRLPAEKSRKFLHVSGGIMCLFFPWFFPSHWWVLALAATSFILLLFTYKKKMLPSVHQTKRRSAGSVLFPVPVYGCFLIAGLLQNDLFYYLPVSLLTIADTAAETGGNTWGRYTRQFFNGQKTLAGTISFFVAALMISFTCLYLYDWHPKDILITGSLIALMGAVTETVTLRGWDNITVPVVTILILLASQ